MHRVYNSAFMHMLRDEDNAGYRSVIRETVAFDPRILGRYVNFMNNPDERTAIDQFGSGDKYFGVATLAGDAARAADVRARPGRGLRREVRHGVPPRDARGAARPGAGRAPRATAVPAAPPALAVRGRGRLPDARRRCAGMAPWTRMCLPIRTRFAGRARWWSTATGSPRAGSAIGGAGPALGIPDDGSAWLVLRDVSARAWSTFGTARTSMPQGLELDLRAYQSHVFLDPEVVWDDPAGDWGRLAWRIGLSGVPDVRAALQDQLLEPARLAVDSLFRVADRARYRGRRSGSLRLRPRRRWSTRPSRRSASRSRHLGRAVGATAGRGVSVHKVQSAAARRWWTWSRSSVSAGLRS